MDVEGKGDADGVADVEDEGDADGVVDVEGDGDGLVEFDGEGDGQIAIQLFSEQQVMLGPQLRVPQFGVIDAEGLGDAQANEEQSGQQ